MKADPGTHIVENDGSYVRVHHTDGSYSESNKISDILLSDILATLKRIENELSVRGAFNIRRRKPR